MTFNPTQWVLNRFETGFEWKLSYGKRTDVEIRRRGA